jgi:enolase
MEAQIAVAAEAMGLKAGGGANTERLVKYGSIIKLMKDLAQERSAKQPAGAVSAGLTPGELDEFIKDLTIAGITAYEEATNAGIPTVGVKVTAGIAGDPRLGHILSFTGSTPLGTSAGTGEAIHLVDSMIVPSEITRKYPDLFKRAEDGTYRFAKDVTDEAIAAKHDDHLSRAWRRASRYEGKGCLNAADNAEGPLARLFVGKKVADLGGIAAIDRMLLEAELKATQDLGLVDAAAASDRASRTAVMQRKGTMGMNAILSLSLALARLSAAVNGKDLWSGIRDQMTETMAKAIASGGGTKILPPELAQRVGSGAGEEAWRAIKAGLTMDELEQGLKALAKAKPKDVKLHEILRQHLPVYG